MTTNRIEQETFVAAPIERVWAVLTDPAHIPGWFGDSAEVELKPGGAAVFGWEEHGPVQAVVERVDPPRAFAYRWANEPDKAPTPGNSTLVEFTLTADGAGTLLRVVETGFAELEIPADKQQQSADGNTEGWTQELGELKTYAEKIDG